MRGSTTSHIALAASGATALCTAATSTVLCTPAATFSQLLVMGHMSIVPMHVPTPQAAKVSGS
jgi:hypothetical protein